MELTFIQEFISPIALVICLAVGYVIKHVLPGDLINQFIPLIAAILGMAICVWIAWEISPEVICQGLVSGLASTGMYEAFKNLLNMGAATQDPHIGGIGGTDE